MPQEQQPRPLASSLRLGEYDNPPASTSEPTSTPQTRSSGLRRALREMRARDTPPPPVNTSALPMPSNGARRSIYTGSGSSTAGRRRRRSSSPDVLSNSNDNQNNGQQSTRQTASDVDARGDSNRYKRRRLQHGYRTYVPLSPMEPLPFIPRPPAIKYGYNGQVAPGRLQLSLVSCDGGKHRDPRHPSTNLGPENLLRHDKSVYCSERPWANVVLRHKDEETAFCLERLWIVGPEGGFTAPVREGVVHVAINLAELRQYIDPPPHARLSDVNRAGRQRRVERNREVRWRSNPNPERLTLAEALRDPEVVAAYHEIMEDDDDENEAPTTTSADPLVATAEYITNPPPAHLLPTHTLPPPPTDLSCPETPAHQAAVTLLTDASGASPGPEDFSPQHVLDYRLQRLRLARRRLEAENWDRAERWGGMRRLDALMARSRVRDEDGEDVGEGEGEGMDGEEEEVVRRVLEVDPAYIFPASDQNSSTATGGVATAPFPPSPAPREKDYVEASTCTSSSGATGANSSPSTVTTAHFRIPEGKHRVALQFNPPVSGRFLLLKLCAAKGCGNVDVQSVIAVGFGGGRYFPAVCIR